MNNQLQNLKKWAAENWEFVLAIILVLFLITRLKF